MFRIKFLRNLLLISTLVAILAPAYLQFVLHPSYHDLLIKQTEDGAVTKVDYLLRTLLIEGRLLSRDSLPANFEERLLPAFSDIHLIKLRFFSVSGEIISSTDQEELGQLNTHDYFRDIVMQGRVYSKVVQKNRLTADGVTSMRDVVETYVPLMSGGEFNGAVEAYNDITDSTLQMEAFTRHSLITCLFLSAGFLLAIGIALRRAAASLKQRDKAEEERRSAYQELKKSQHELLTVAENIPVGVFRCDIAGRLIWSNSLADFFLSAPEKGEPLDWSKICRPDDLQRIAFSWELVVSRGKRVKEEFRLQVSGAEVWTQFEVVPEYDLQEKVVGFVGTLTNVSELKHAEAEIKASQLALMQQDKMASVGQLAAGVAHEINNPMGFVTSNLVTLGRYLSSLIRFSAEQTSQLAAAPVDDGRAALVALRKELQIDFILDDAGALLEESLDGANRVKAIVQNLKDYARVDQTAKRSENLNECLDTTLALISSALPAGVRIEKHYDVLPLINCYTQFLQQAFMNILKNAMLAIGSEGLIGIRTWVDGNAVRVAISDNGCGIDPQDLPHIFEPFFTTRTIGDGTGLGLSFTYDTVEKHNGQIEVASELGKGTTFTITLPVRPSDSAGTEPS